jgi:hypothetical protein
VAVLDRVDRAVLDRAIALLQDVARSRSVPPISRSFAILLQQWLSSIAIVSIAIDRARLLDRSRSRLDRAEVRL